jgi:hypothetical protein
VKARKLLTAVLIVALLAVYYLVGTDYLKERRDKESLTSQVSQATQALALIPSPPADLETRLDGARTGLEDAQNVFPAQLNSTGIIDYILRLADDAGVKAIPLLTQPWEVQSVEENNLRILRLQISVTGTYNGMSSFLSRLENGEVETLVMEYVTVDSIAMPFKGGDIYGNSSQINARLEVAVYTQPPAIETEPEEEGTSL